MGDQESLAQILERINKQSKKVDAVKESTDGRPEANQPGPADLFATASAQSPVAETDKAKTVRSGQTPSTAEAKTPEPKALNTAAALEEPRPEKLEPPPLSAAPPDTAPPVFIPVSKPVDGGPVVTAAAPPQASSPSRGASGPASRPPVPPPYPSDPPLRPPPPPRGGSDSFEKMLWPWLSRIGVALVFFGAVFFLKVAYDHLGDVGRLACGIGLGLAFLVGGELSQRRKDSPPGLALVAGGIMLLYLSFYAGFAEFKIIEQTTAFILLGMVTAAGVALSLRHNTQLMMVLALAGGFLTPVMVSTDVDNQAALMTYIAILDLAVIGISSWRRWPVMTWLCYGATVLLFLIWGHDYYNSDKLGLTILFASIYFAIFSVSSILHRLVQKKDVGPERLVVVAFTTALYFIPMFLLMRDAGAESMNGLFALSVSAFFFIKSRVTAAVSPNDLLLRRFLTGLAVFFATLAIPLQLDFETVTVAWGAEALALTAYGLYTRDKSFQAGGLIVLALVFVHLFFEDMPEYRHYLADGRGAMLVEVIALGFGSARAAFGGVTWLHQRRPAEMKFTPEVFLVSWIFELLFLLFAALLLNYYSFHGGYFPSFYRDAHLGERLNVSLILGIYSFAVIAVGIVRNQAWVRYIGLPTLGFALLKVVFYDLAKFDWNYRMISFMALGGLLIALSFIYNRYREKIAQWVGAPSNRSN